MTTSVELFPRMSAFFDNDRFYVINETDQRIQVIFRSAMNIELQSEGEVCTVFPGTGVNGIRVRRDSEGELDCTFDRPSPVEATGQATLFCGG